MKSRLSSAVPAAVLALALFAGCDGKPAQKAAPAANATTPTATPAAGPRVDPVVNAFAPSLRPTLDKVNANSRATMKEAEEK